MKHKTVMISVIAIIIAIFLIGQAIVYYANPYSSSMTANRIDDNTVQFNINTNISQDCTVVSLSNTNSVDSYCAFYDNNYPYRSTSKESVDKALGWMEKAFAKDSISFRTVNADELKELMSGSNKNTAVIFLTGTIPETVYQGKSTDLIFEWLSEGGTMYWINGKIGQTYAKYGETKTTSVKNSDSLFFDAKDIVRKSTDRITSYETSPGSLTEVLCATYSECTNGLAADKLSVPHITLDNSYDGYYSTTICKYHGGTGSICVFGGKINLDMLYSVMQVMESGLSYDTKMTSHTVVHGCCSGTIQCTANSRLFAYIGQMESAWRGYVLV